MPVRNPVATANVVHALQVFSPAATLRALIRRCASRVDDARRAREVANRVVMMDEGVVVEEGTPDKVFSTPSQERTKTFLSKIL